MFQNNTWFLNQNCTVFWFWFSGFSLGNKKGIDHVVSCFVLCLKWKKEKTMWLPFLVSNAKTNRLNVRRPVQYSIQKGIMIKRIGKNQKWAGFDWFFLIWFWHQKRLFVFCDCCKLMMFDVISVSRRRFSPVSLF